MNANNFSFASFNQTRDFEVDNSNFVSHTRQDVKGKEYESTYWKAEEVFMEFGEDHIYSVQGVYVNDLSGNRNAITLESAAVAIEDRYVTVPSFQIKDIKRMLESDYAIKMIRDGHLGFTIESYISSLGKTCYKLVWCDLA